MFQSLQSCIISCTFRQMNARGRCRFRALPPECDSPEPEPHLKIICTSLNKGKIFSLFCRLGESLTTKFSDNSGSDDGIHRNRSPKSYRMTHPVGQITKRLPRCKSISRSPFPQPSLILTLLTPLGGERHCPNPIEHLTLVPRSFS